MAQIKTTVYITSIGYYSKVIKIGGGKPGDIIEISNTNAKGHKYRLDISWASIIPEKPETRIDALFTFSELDNNQLISIYHIVKDISRSGKGNIVWVDDPDILNRKFEIGFNVPSKFLPTTESRIIQLLMSYLEEDLEVYIDNQENKKESENDQ